MKTISVGILPSFIRSVREAQGLPQKDIAQKIHVWPSALTQYEKSDASLSKEKLLEIAPLLNLNPEFIRQGVGNPFKAADKSSLIKMSLILTEEGKIDLNLIRFIADFSEKSAFIFLKPIDVPKDKPRLVSKWRRSGNTIYALLVQDDDGNRFLFKRTDDSFFNESEIVPLLSDSMGYHKFHKVSVSGISSVLFEKIKGWGNLSRSDFDSLIATAQSRDKIEMLSELIDILSNYEATDEDKKNLERLKTIFQNIEPQNASDLLDTILPKFVRILSNTVHA
jgi:transcriptional regulator with XRE-family HTH domain